MNQRKKFILDNFKSAVINLKEGVEAAEDELDIDGAIKRFELCYELSWKLIKEYLSDKGLIVNNPRDSFKAAYQNELIDNEEVWLKMIEDRNILVHTYNFEQSRETFSNIKEEYIKSFEHLLKKIEQEFLQ